MASYGGLQSAAKRWRRSLQLVALRQAPHDHPTWATNHLTKVFNFVITEEGSTSRCAEGTRFASLDDASRATKFVLRWKKAFRFSLLFINDVYFLKRSCGLQVHSRSILDCWCCCGIGMGRSRWAPVFSSKEAFSVSSSIAGEWGKVSETSLSQLSSQHPIIDKNWCSDLCSKVRRANLSNISNRHIFDKLQNIPLWPDRCIIKIAASIEAVNECHNSMPVFDWEPLPNSRHCIN